MNFYQAQHDARRNTWRLGLLFLAAVVTLVVLTNLLVAVVYLWSSNAMMPITGSALERLLQAMPWQNWLYISLGVIAVVAAGCAYRYLGLSAGGKQIAEALGGRRLAPNSRDPAERRLLNVVEEMAIASGTPVPPVYLIPEDSINAFAAGLTLDDAVIGINQGTLELLNRDELQGVIGHEFSHILNGDMRLNLRLIALLHGILFLGLIGRGVLRGSYHGGAVRSRRSSASSGGLPILVLGLGLLIIGYGGTFFGNLIKAAVSRQREFLADAASVQFTRNPNGIAEALKKIGGHLSGSRMTSAAAEEASHLFFGECGKHGFTGLLATHPPLEERIRAIQPRWNGEFPVLVPADLRRAPADAEAAGPSAARLGTAAVSGFAAAVEAPGRPAVDDDALLIEIDPDSLSEEVGRLDQHSLDAAVDLLEDTGERLRDAARDPFGCRALIYAMVLSPRDGLRRAQRALIDRQAEAGVPEQVDALADALAGEHEAQRLALVELAMPALKSLSPTQYARFMNNVAALIKLDRQIELFEWVLHRLLVKELTPHFGRPRPARPRYGRLQPLEGEIHELLSAVARAGHPDDEAAAARALQAGLRSLAMSDAGGLVEADPNFSRLNRALGRLRQVKPLTKPRLIKACAATARADGRIGGAQGALLQGIAAALDCPLPPSIYSTRQAPTLALSS